MHSSLYSINTYESEGKAEETEKEGWGGEQKSYKEKLTNLRKLLAVTFKYVVYNENLMQHLKNQSEAETARFLATPCPLCVMPGCHSEMAVP